MKLYSTTPVQASNEKAAIKKIKAGKFGLTEINGTEKKFPNGFTSWIETHYEVASYISKCTEGDFEPTGIIAQTMENRGTCGLYELAEELTNEFEEKNKGRKWDGEFFEEIESFLYLKLIK